MHKTSLVYGTTAIRGGTETPFANRWSRCKKLGKKVPQAYRVYVEDTFLPCDAADARIFAKEEVINMLIAEYDYDTDIAVQRRESLMIGLQQGLAEGKSLGFAEGSHQTKLETARNLCVMGLSVENIAKATGLTPAEVEAIK